jgi:hypothetical protein
MNPMKPGRCTRIEFYITLVELPVSRSNGKTRTPSDEGLDTDEGLLFLACWYLRGILGRHVEMSLYVSCSLSGGNTESDVFLPLHVRTHFHNQKKKKKKNCTC